MQNKDSCVLAEKKERREGGNEGGKGRRGREGRAKQGRVQQKEHEFLHELDQIPMPTPPHSSCVTVGTCVGLSVHIQRQK